MRTPQERYLTYMIFACSTLHIIVPLLDLIARSALGSGLPVLFDFFRFFAVTLDALCRTMEASVRAGGTPISIGGFNNDWGTQYPPTS